MSAPDENNRPACEGRPDLFDPDALNPELAIRLCNTCPVKDWCATERAQFVADGGIPHGIWAGQWGVSLGGAVSTRTARRAGTRAQRLAEEAAFDDGEARRASSAYRRHGDRSEWAAVGNRVYQRRKKRNQADRVKVAS